MTATVDHGIRKATIGDVSVLTDVIRRAFRDVADRFGLTAENCPKHPSNCEREWIESDLARGVAYFVLAEQGRPCGCVAVEAATDDTCYLERLAVLPQRRNAGFGRRLVERALREAWSARSSVVSVGIIARHHELREWYRRLGFAEAGLQRFPHLPFEVAFLRYDLVPSESDATASERRGREARRDRFRGSQ
jgi:N-acetylglutamate synthase-like GNAT family acetyltransferase